jgi:hypothetical protein
MPTLSASDYTNYLKFKAAAGSTIKPAIQTRDNVALSQSLINANLLTSQAAFVTTPSTTTVTTLATVTAVTATPVTDARTDILSAATAGTNVIQYTSSQPHGLSNGQTITITGFGAGTLSVTPNQTAATITVTGATTFTIASVGVTGSATGTGSITNRVYYTTSVAHGLQPGDVTTIASVTTFSATGATVASVPSTTTFVLTSATTGSAVTGQLGTITLEGSPIVYVTTGSASGVTAGTSNLSITGVATAAFNLSLVTAYRAASSTVFLVQSSASGTAVTGQSGTLTQTTYANTNVTLTRLGRVVARQVPQFRSNPDALSTLSFAGTSGALSSSRVQRPGGLPTGFRNSQGTYTRLPQNAGW